MRRNASRVAFSANPWTGRWRKPVSLAATEPVLNPRMAAVASFEISDVIVGLVGDETWHR